MEYFTYEFCKDLLVRSGAAILVIGCVSWGLYMIAETLYKAGRLIARFVKWVRAKRHSAEGACPEEDAHGRH